MHHAHFDELEAALRAVSDDDGRCSASPAVEARLLQEVRAIARARRVASLKMFAAAAVLVLAVSGSVWSLLGPAEGLRIADSPSGIAVVQSERTTEFFPLYYSNVPAADVRLVRLEVPRTALASFGLEIGEPPVNDGGATVLADVAVGADGLARAIRFIGIGNPYGAPLRDARSGARQ